MATNSLKNRITLNLKENSNTDFFDIWVKLLTPFIKTTKKDSELLAELLRKRYELSTKVKDNVILDNLLFSKEVRQDIRKTLGYSVTELTNTLASLRNKQLIGNSSIVASIIPSVDLNQKSFTFTFNIELNERKTT